MEIISEVEKGGKKKDIADRFGIPANSLSTILKNREKIESQHGSLNLNKKKIKPCTYDQIDTAVLKWVQLMRDKNLPISGAFIKNKALEFAQKFNLPDFQASTGWLDKFKQRHGLLQKTICGESADVHEEDCTAWKETILSKLLKDYNPKDIFNADETGLFFKCLPSKTLAFKNDKCFGGKNSKDRITLMVASNMTGSEKIKLLVIGKSKNPRCFKGVKSLETGYDFNKKSWMTGEIYEKWLVQLDKDFLRQKRQVVLFVDNCPAHPRNVQQKLKAIKLVYFPPNMTSRLQPMDQGIIKNLKIHYRKRILTKILNAVENNESPDKVISLRYAIAEISKAWACDVTPTTITNCFAKAGFKIPEEMQDDDEDNEKITLAELMKKWKKLKQAVPNCEEVELEDYLQIDDDVTVAEYPDENDILNDILGVNDAEENNDEDDVEEFVNVSEADVLSAFSTIRRGLQLQENVPDNLFVNLSKVESFFEQRTIFKNRVQTKITDFFRI